ncbi:MAG TPA: permease [Actinomycetota bacterium]|nr:permease [Actinomycetota bacterium]
MTQSRTRIQAPQLARTDPAWRNGILVLAALAAAALLVRLVNGAGVPAVQNFILVFGSLLVEALPFIALGAAVSALIEVFIPASAFARLARLPRPLQMPVAGLGGFAFPVCECGSVPVARRLLLKGLTPAAAITFMLAAPILNPVVLIATAVAYRGRDILWPMVLGRAGLGLVVAMAVGWVMATRSRGDLLRDADPARGAGHDHGASGDSREGRWARYFGQLGADFSMLTKYLIVGAAVASALQTFVPQSVIGGVAETPILSVLALMVLAAMLSLCSESDAFVAASFVQFGMAAQLGFLVVGPMIDAKLGVLYAGTFNRRFAVTVTTAVFAVTLAGSLWMQVLFG